MIHLTSCNDESRSVNGSFDSSTFLSGPFEPTRLLRAHFRAFPVAPKNTRQECVQMASLPARKSLMAYMAAWSSVVLLVCRKVGGGCAPMARRSSKLRILLQTQPLPLFLKNHLCRQYTWESRAIGRCVL